MDGRISQADGRQGRLRSAALAWIVALVVLLWPRAGHAETTIDLYTIGPGSYLFARYGHSLLCARDAGDKTGATGRCFDYGVPDREDFTHVAWDTIRGRAIFAPVRIDEPVMLQVFRDQGRSIDRQRLPLPAADAERLAKRLDADVEGRVAYAYHPYYANCTTQVRDRIDSVLPGRLRAESPFKKSPRYRDLSEAGLTGKLVELTALSLLLGTPAERTPNAWEGMFLPVALEEGVERLGAAPEKIEEAKAVILPTSTAVGRIALFLLAFALFVFVRVAWRRPALGRRAALGAVALVLGALALVCELVAVLVVWPEFGRNWSLVALLPTDLALPFLPDRILRVYVKARMAIGALLFVGEIVGVVEQPIFPVSVLVVLPMLAIHSSMRDAKRRREAASAPLGAVSAPPA